MKKIAVIGFGGQGHWHYWQSLNSDVISFVGAYDTDIDKRNQAKKEGVYIYDSNEAIFADKNIDIIVIATPNDVHEELSIRALETGHNVVCEKPVTLSVESFDRIVKVAEKNKKIFSVHQNRRWDKEYVAIKNIIDSRKFGEAIRLENRVHGSRGVPKDWRLLKEHGGGMMYDWGVHLIDQVMNIFPEKIVEINCNLTNITSADVDDGFYLDMLFENGFKAHIQVCTYNFLPLPRFYLQCEQATCLISTWNENVKVNKLTVWNDKEVVPVETSSGITKTMAPRDNQSTELCEIKLPEPDVHDFYRNLCDAIDGKAEQAVKNSEVRRVLQVIEAAFKSDKLHERIKTEI